jgi:hypothetical protein
MCSDRPVIAIAQAALTGVAKQQNSAKIQAKRANLLSADSIENFKNFSPPQVREK